MNDTAIIIPFVDVARVTKQIAAAHIELQDAENRTESARQEQAKRRLELGRLLIEARKAWPARGPKAKGWGDMLASVGIEQQRASEWMRLAGYVEISPSSANDGETVPTLRDAGIDKRPRKGDEPTPLHTDESPKPAGTTNRKTEPEPDPAVLRISSHANDIAKSLMSINRELVGLAKRWPRRSRVELVETLLSVAGQIDGMTDD